MIRSPVISLFAALALTACGGGSGSGAPAAGSAGVVPLSCDGSCANSSTALSVTQVETVIARAIVEAQARNARATIAVVDRVGNVLAVYAMNGASPNVTVRSKQGAADVDGGLENVTVVPATLAAIAKAITGAYLSSEGNAFSTRTASQIVQAHFNPGEVLTPGGPLFGVQFSQLPCSDVATRFQGGATSVGPQRSPLGLSADPGGFPLYLDGTPVGGVGVVADGVYGLDANPLDRDDDLDEAIAVAATVGLAAPEDRRADRITADGKTLRFSDIEVADLRGGSNTPPTLAAQGAAVGRLVAVSGYATASVRAGTAFGQSASGIRADSRDYAGLDAFVLVDAANTERFRPRAGSEASGALSAVEVQQVLSSALRVAARARAQIRRPLGTPARVSIAVVDSNGVLLGLVRTRDAPVFGIDVAVQKARTAAFFSSPRAATILQSLPPAVYLDRGLVRLRAVAPVSYLPAMRNLLGVPTVLGDGQIAFSARAIGNLARPNFPDGVDGNPPGPLSKSAGQWSPFSTGLQLDLVYNAIIQHVAFVAGIAPDVPAQCAGISGFDAGFSAQSVPALLANGVQIFPGGVPIHRGEVLIGAIGVSGDGIDQDDMIAFLGLAQVGFPAGGPQHPLASRRADQLAPNGARLRYVSCPQSPFLDSSEQEPCRGL
ncbi:MAG: heme-binding protein [Sinobacteraceae bacterium]|nr:heme-binding protein [Nevskiaceae bacterium]